MFLHFAVFFFTF